MVTNKDLYIIQKTLEGYTTEVVPYSEELCNSTEFYYIRKSDNRWYNKEIKFNLDSGLQIHVVKDWGNAVPFYCYVAYNNVRFFRKEFSDNKSGFSKVAVMLNHYNSISFFDFLNELSEGIKNENSEALELLERDEKRINREIELLKENMANLIDLKETIDQRIKMLENVSYTTLKDNLNKVPTTFNYKWD